MATVKKLLKGCEVRRMQTVGMMQIIPLVSDAIAENFISPLNKGKVSTTGYGSMRFRNESDKTMIVPSHIGYMTKKHAQDHALAKAGFVKARSQHTYDDAMCIESSQPGYMEESDDKEAIILPVHLREDAVKQSDRDSGYNRLWGSISTYNSTSGVNDSGGHLRLFYEKYAKELDQFVAEFEPVPKQVGAIVLINGAVVGVERVPNYEFWRDIWEPIIRSSYGAEAVRTKHQNAEVDIKRFQIDLDRCDNLLDIVDELDRVQKKEYSETKNVVMTLLNDEMTVKAGDTSGDMRADTVGNQQFIGQVVYHQNRPVYTSMVTKALWRKHHKWNEAADLSL